MSQDWRTWLYEHSPAGMQDLLLSAVGSKLLRRRFGVEYQEWMRLCEQAESWTAAEHAAYAREQISRLVRRAYEHVPYYRRLMDRLHLKPDDIRDLSDLHKLPPLTKEAIRENRDAMLADDVPRRGLILGHTSGTTGSPLEFWWDKKVEIATNAMIWRHRQFAGFHFGRAYATLLGRVVVPTRRKKPPFWRYNRPWRQLFLSSFHLHPENLDAYLDEMAKVQVEALEAYPSSAYILARHLEGRGRYLPLKAVFTSSETLMAIQRQVIEERFRCKVFDYYGQAERVMYSGECEAHAGHHHFPEYGAMEVVGDRGEPVPPGGLGKLLLTGYANDAMPLLRYEIGDVSGFSTRQCPCGRTLPLIADIATKAEDIVVTPDGRFLSPSALTHPFKPMNNIQASQIIQEDINHLTIKVIRKPGYSDADTRMLLEAMQERVGLDMKMRVEFVETLQSSGRGKFRWVVSRVPLTFSGRTRANLHQE